MTFGQKLKRLLKENNMSQEDLAEQLGVSRQAAGKWTNDKGMPEVSKLIQISNLFGISLDYLLKEDYEESQKEKQGENQQENQNQTHRNPAPADSGYYVSQEMLNGYTAYSRQKTLRITGGICLFILSGLFEGPGCHNFLLSLLYWMTVTADIGLIIWHFSIPRQYEEIRTEHLLLDGLVFEEFKKKRETRRKHYAVMMIAGAAILLAGSEAEYFFLAHFENNICNIFLTLSDAVCLSLIIWSGMSMYADSLIVRNASQAPGRTPLRRYRWIYAALPVTAGAVIVGIATNIWSPYAPILILFCCLLAAACRLLIERKE
jgi:Predicted transcriptional regulators